jgi:phage terminase large subunit
LAETAIKIPYNPRPAFRGFHRTKKRFGVMVCHRRAGKTVAAMNRLVKSVMTCPKPNPRVAYIGPTFSQAKDIVWGYAKDYTRTIPGARFFEYDLRIDLPNGGRIKLYGAENPDRLRGMYFDDVVFDEFASMSPAIWEDVVRPALTDRQGSAVFLGTPKGLDAFYELWQYAQTDPDWYCLDEYPEHVMKASVSGILKPEELIAAFKLMDEAKYAREYECDFMATFEGAYYAENVRKCLAEGRFRAVPYDPAADVYAAWDLGMDDATSIWIFQVTHSEWRFLDYMQDEGKGLDHYINWIKKLPYAVDMNFLPHDAKVRELTNAGKSRQLFLEDRHLKTMIVKKHAPEERIAAVRMLFPRMYFDNKVQQGLNALRMYKAQYNERTQVMSYKPLHDKMSHAADALGYGVMGMNEEFGVQFAKTDWKKPITRDSAGSYV